MNLLQDTTNLALAVCEKYLQDGDTSVDCTCGRGHDTLFLAQRCRRVYSFDIQQEAIESAGDLLSDSGITWEIQGPPSGFAPAVSGSAVKVTFINDSHVSMENYVAEEPAVIIFNLGYLPGGDKSVTTTADTTSSAVKKALEKIKTGGLVCVSIYPGHEEGRREKEALKKFARTLEKGKYHCVYADMLNQGDKAPEILWITKKK